MYVILYSILQSDYVGKRGAILLTSSVLVLKIEVTSLRIEYQFFFCDITIVDINIISCHLLRH